jgi:hypothetical protein
MSNDELTEITKNIVEFTQQYFHALTYRAGQMLPGLDGKIAEATPSEAHADPLRYMMEPQEWLAMAKYAVDLLPDADPGYIYEICQDLAEWLFSIPGLSVYEIPAVWQEHPVGALWWSAFVRSQGDELITIAAAAKLAGVSVQAISQRIDRGSLEAFINPLAKERQGKRLVRRSDVKEESRQSRQQRKSK